jgi:5-formyltetrahydrofolate cyclo-ligase
MPADPLRKSAMGVMEPLPSAERLLPSSATLVVVPALAIDARGFRIGYGKGFYDRFLAAHSEVMSIGVAYDFQLISESPVTTGDVPVSTVVTDTRTLFGQEENPGTETDPVTG